MKVFVTHDDHGKIASIGAPAAQFAASIGVKPKAGQRVTVLDVPEIQHLHHFDKYLREYRVDVRSDNPKFVKK